MSHPIVHIEFSATDHRAAARFYAEVFDWVTQEYPDMKYTTFEGPEGSTGGGFNNVSEDYPAGTVLVYINTDDVNATLEKVEAAGGKTIVPKFEISGVGHSAIFTDPTGNWVALLEPLMDQS